MSLQEELDGFKQGFCANAPIDVQKKMEAATQVLADSGMLSKAIGTGNTLPEFNLPNHLGDTVNSFDLLTQGPLIITFYRGGWCPYCNLELRAYHDAQARINAAGATLVAITPELPDESLNTVEKNELGFHVLTDRNSEYARQLGLVHTLPKEVTDIYQGFGIDVEKHNGKGQFDLPLPATYVVAKSGVVFKSFVEVDYRNRMEPEIAIAALQSMDAAA